jgi:hypothetical protein
MFVVLVGGYPHQRTEFMQMVEAIYDERVVWVNDKKSFYYIANLFIYFGGPISTTPGKLVITWSGDHLETIHRVYKTLGL